MCCSAESESGGWVRIGGAFSIRCLVVLEVSHSSLLMTVADSNSFQPFVARLYRYQCISKCIREPISISVALRTSHESALPSLLINPTKAFLLRAIDDQTARRQEKENLDRRESINLHVA